MRVATLTLTSDGVVHAASPEVATWWRVPDASGVIGRPFARLFFFDAPSAAGSPDLGAWQLLQTAASTRPLTLQARVDGGGFEAVVHLTSLAPSAGDATSAAYSARVERHDPVSAPQVPRTQPIAAPAMAPVPTATLAPGNESTPALASAASAVPVQPLPTAAATPAATPSVRDEPAAPKRPVPKLPSDECGEDELDDTVDAVGAEEDPDDLEAEDSYALDEIFADEKVPPVETGPGPAPADCWEAWSGGNVGFFEIDFARGVARHSEAWCRLLGYEIEDVADEVDTLRSLFHPDDSDAAPGPETRGRRGARVPFSAEARLRTKDSAWRWMQFEGMQTFGADGFLTHLVGIMLDSQERHEFEDELARVEDRFRQLLSAARHGHFELDLINDTGVFSPEFRHALGFSAKDLPPTPDGFLRLLAPEEAELGVDSFFNMVADSSAGLTRRLRLRHHDGRDLDFDVMLGVQRGRHGEIQRVIGALAPAAGDEPAAPSGTVAASTTSSAGTTATEKLAEAARLALDAVGEAVVLTDETGCISHLNFRAAQWLGGDPQKITGRSLSEVFAFVDRGTDVPAPEIVRRVLDGGSPLELDHRYALIDATGDRADVVITCRAMHDVRKRVCGGIVILRKPAEMPLSPAELVASNRMETLGRLACGIAHDFNNILTTVTGGISLAQDRRDWEPLAPAQKALGTARNLARQLLTFARGDSAERKVQSINDVIKETARLTSAGSKSSVTLELGSDVHPVNLDAVRIVQVFTNLILNAMQVMPAGGRIWVRTQNMRLGQVNSVALTAGDYVRVEVQDNGPGIPPENLEHIFEPFFSTRSGGTGLGLAMVRSIVTQHEGAIEVASTIGTGTTFTLYFPRASSTPVNEASKPMAVTFGTGRILIMDDDADLCMVAKGMLEVLGYEADTATTGEAAIAAVRKYRDMGRHYAAVILDLTMAGGPGGEDVLPKLREIDPQTVAIVSSGYATEDQIERYQQLGFRGVLAKPYRSGDLGRTLKEVLGATPKT